MKIIQIVSHLNLHDAIGNEMLAMDEALKQKGYDSGIMAAIIHEGLRSRAEEIDLNAMKPDDLVIFHKATGDLLIKAVSGLPCRKVLVYHNITPAGFFAAYDPLMAANLCLGHRQLRRYAPRMDACWADSSYNALELRKCRNVTVLPILFSEREKTIMEDPETTLKLRENGRTKLLCIGRVAPNKKLENAIKLYVRYRERYDPDAVLYIVGSWDGIEKYYAKLKGFCADLKMTDDQVVFTGKVTEEEKEAYLRNSDVLVCMSEHEGFCVPLLEAAKRNLPVLAYAAAAVPETLGSSDLLYGKKDYSAMADGVNSVRTDEAFRSRIIQAQKENLKRFDRSRVREQFLDLVEKVLS